MNDMYLEDIMDHYKSPRNQGRVEGADIIFYDTNPLCGDEVQISVQLQKDTIKDFKFIGKGCAISVAATSMLSDHIKGKHVDEVRTMKNEAILGLLGIEISPMRLKCALLGLKATQKSIIEHLARNKK